ncbi:type II toxin-antitoxin system tRNA(fMet)-specific endonuclease VapC [Plasticicumulans sp.]|mgnify:CR=1 FL=1|uniref:type II toxin-antitoxin system tRNA(fMet)-specific endonuclease VapC n=1 Tax=Plasticicumulans sp. TaxID=2307179 RepID=UPI002B778C68|nr:type II toxin-antitoxin system VapC family toxin [Plasticicumulans sp.]HNA05208.1 type II toxin-antitoxin system VapC family toxin [Rhodocyclaceae bacterium]
MNDLRYLLDTNICIYISKCRPLLVRQRFENIESAAVGMSVITWGELCFGARKSQSSQRAMEVLEQLQSMIRVVPITTEVGEHYGDIRASLERGGRPIGNNDLWIAAHARALACTLVTNNEREFVRVPDLSVENWLN